MTVHESRRSRFGGRRRVRDGVFLLPSVGGREWRIQRGGGGPSWLRVFRFSAAILLAGSTWAVRAPQNLQRCPPRGRQLIESSPLAVLIRAATRAQGSGWLSRIQGVGLGRLKETTDGLFQCSSTDA